MKKLLLICLLLTGCREIPKSGVVINKYEEVKNYQVPVFNEDLKSSGYTNVPIRKYELLIKNQANEFILEVSEEEAKKVNIGDKWQIPMEESVK